MAYSSFPPELALTQNSITMHNCKQVLQHCVLLANKYHYNDHPSYGALPILQYEQ